MKKIKNKKGFTLTELLVTIVIIGVLSSIGIVSLINLRKNQEIKFNNTQLQVFKQTAQTYFTDNKEKLPLDFGEERVYLDELIENNYIDKLVDYSKNEYNEEKSYVEVLKVPNGYVYTAKLVTNDNEIVDDNSSGNTTGTINFSIPESNPVKCTNDSNEYKEKCTGNMIDKEYYTNSNVKLDIELSDQNGILGYYYNIYRNSNSKKISVYRSDYIYASENNKESYSDVITLDTNKYDDGKYTVEIIGVNSKFQKISRETKEIYIDMTKPTCKRSKEPNVYWANKNTTVTAICSDNGSGCKTKEEEETIEAEGSRNVKLTVEDKAGNETKCDSIPVRIDKTAPTCTTSGESTKWTNGNRKLNFTCSDGGSGCKTGCSTYNSKEGGCDKSFTTKTITDSAKTLTFSGDKAIKVEDAAGNTTICKSSQNKNSNGNPSSVFNIYVDNKKPTCNISLDGIKGDNSWYKQTKVTLKLSTSDTGGSGVSTYGMINRNEKTYNKKETLEQGNTNGITYYGYVKDAAGNENFCNSGNFKVDITAPTISNVSNSSNGNLTCGNVVVGSSATDNLSGVNQIMYSYDNSNWKTDWNTNNINSVSGTWSAKRNNTLYVRACDKAGNCSGSKTTTVHIGVNSASSVCGTERQCQNITSTCTEPYYVNKGNNMTKCPNGGVAVKYTYCGTTGSLCCKYTRSYSCQKQSCQTVNKTCCHD